MVLTCQGSRQAQDLTPQPGNVGFAPLGPFLYGGSPAREAYRLGGNRRGICSLSVRPLILSDGFVSTEGQGIPSCHEDVQNSRKQGHGAALACACP